MTEKHNHLTENTNPLSNQQCLACLEQYSTHQLYLLSSKNFIIESCKQTLAEIYYQCTQLVIEVTHSHVDENWICPNCTEKLVEFFQFRKMCIDSYNTLKGNEALSIANDALNVEVIEGIVNDVQMESKSVIKSELQTEDDSIYSNIDINYAPNNKCGKTKFSDRSNSDDDEEDPIKCEADIIITEGLSFKQKDFDEDEEDDEDFEQSKSNDSDFKPVVSFFL